MKSIKSTKIIFVVFTLLFTVATVSACSFNSSISIGNYVSQVNSNVQQAVGLTREFRKIKDNLDTRSPDDAKECTELLDKLSELYTNLIKLDAPERYTDIDEELKNNSKTALTKLSELESLISTSQSTGDDTLYQHDSQTVIDKYEEAYTSIVELSAQAQTRFRND